MRLKFKNQEFQEAATSAICDVFAGQPYCDPNVYTVDSGNPKAKPTAALEQGEFAGLGTLSQGPLGLAADDEPEVGYKNAELAITPADFVKNLHEVQETPRV